MRECWWTEVEVILEGKKSDSTNSARAEEDQKKESIHFNIAGWTFKFNQSNLNL